jgi:sucrose phosphorylase
LITYGDSILPKEGAPLKELATFVRERLGNSVSIVHILPYFPWTSDDGFAVSDYTQVKPDLGDWSDLEDLSQDYRIMSDLVVNHCSTSHEWFQQFEKDEEPGRRFFLEASPLEDLSEVVRPRTSPLLRPTPTPSGMKHVWCTFGHDQVDLNFRDHDLLVELVKIIRSHLDHGIGVFRLDAVAFVWKEIGTKCINLAQTHELVRLFRTLIEHVKPDAVIITETNIPNQENLSYFGNGNEAHGIYNFSLPPLLLYSLTFGDCRCLIQWLMRMPPAQPGTMYFNFIASHDGIGLRPAEGLLSQDEIQSMVNKMLDYGGLVSERALPDGSKRPYEINISLFDALQSEEKFLCAHTILLGLEGVPAFYIHSLLGTRNERDGVINSGINRRINRRQWKADDLNDELDNESSPHARVLRKLLHLISLRREQTAFHPNATQFTLHMGDQVFAFWRQSIDRRNSIFCLNNVSGEEQRIPVASINLISTEEWLDLISGDVLEDEQGDIILAPYQCVWLANRRKHLPY